MSTGILQGFYGCFYPVGAGYFVAVFVDTDSAAHAYSGTPVNHFAFNDLPARQMKFVCAGCLRDAENVCRSDAASGHDDDTIPGLLL